MAISVDSWLEGSSSSTPSKHAAQSGHIKLSNTHVIDPEAPSAAPRVKSRNPINLQAQATPTPEPHPLEHKAPES